MASVEENDIPYSQAAVRVLLTLKAESSSQEMLDFSERKNPAADCCLESDFMAASVLASFHRTPSNGHHRNDIGKTGQPREEPQLRSCQSQASLRKRRIQPSPNPNWLATPVFSKLCTAGVFVVYGCETWTLTLREEQRLRVFENKVLRKIFGAKRDEVTGEWRKLHNAELHALYPSPDIIRNIKSRRLRWAGHVARMGESRNAYRVPPPRVDSQPVTIHRRHPRHQVLLLADRAKSHSTQKKFGLDVGTRGGQPVDVCAVCGKATDMPARVLRQVLCDKVVLLVAVVVVVILSGSCTDTSLLVTAAPVGRRASHGQIAPSGGAATLSSKTKSCPEEDVGVKTYLAQTVFEGKARSRSPVRDGVYNVTFVVQHVFKGSEPGFLGSQVRLRFAEKAVGAACVDEGNKSGVVRASVWRGGKYIVFADKVEQHIFKARGEPAKRNEKIVKAVRDILCHKCGKSQENLTN
ncbi:hypothetical protein ANN_15069 [Periplaneta americana]|uniref:Vein beta-barrel domain-containing protein n=1 Tax=Periplaneta americana TaxID=6978 RepID=A0ABQ8SZN6_PERAM|nr:hypothetical protein ANN_15069 [Periplaneta americana]